MTSEPTRPMRAAQRIVIEHPDGSRHDFSRVVGGHEWRLTHTAPPELAGEQLNVTGYDRFNVMRVIVACLDGET